MLRYGVGGFAYGGAKSDVAVGQRTDGLIRTVDAYIKMSNDDTKIVPRRGAVAKKADLIAWREMLVPRATASRNCSTRD